LPAKLRKKYQLSIVNYQLFRNFASVMEKKRHALRKLLEAVEKELLKKPNRKTLDRLSLLAGFQDWDSFQETLHGDLGGETIYGGHHSDKDNKEKN
jgi:hypothetical protein